MKLEEIIKRLEAALDAERVWECNEKLRALLDELRAVEVLAEVDTHAQSFCPPYADGDELYVLDELTFKGPYDFEHPRLPVRVTITRRKP